MGPQAGFEGEGKLVGSSWDNGSRLRKFQKGNRTTHGKGVATTHESSTEPLSSGAVYHLNISCGEGAIWVLRSELYKCQVLPGVQNPALSGVVIKD